MTIPPITMPTPITVTELPKITYATRHTAAASIAGGIIAASGRPHSVEEALKILEDVHFAMWPASGNDSYEKWKSHCDLFKVHA